MHEPSAQAEKCSVMFVSRFYSTTKRKSGGLDVGSDYGNVFLAFCSTLWKIENGKLKIMST